MAFIGEAVLTVVIETLFEKLASSDLLQFARQEEVLADINKWEKTLRKLHAVLEDAEEKQLTSRLVKMWLDDLRDLAYDVEDILDEFATEVLGRKLKLKIMAAAAEADQTQASCTCRTKKWRRLIPTSCCTNFTPAAIKFNRKMRSKIEDITSSLQDISAQMNDLQLAESIAAGTRRPTTTLTDLAMLPTTCSVDDSRICGREKDKAAILELLFDDDGAPIICDDNDVAAVRVIAIIGMGGLGKTTLAQLAYNHDRAQSNFDLRVWVCVSDDFDVLKLTKTILQSVASGGSDVNDLNQLQLKLKEGLSGKKFLLVLDDVWNENVRAWETFYHPIMRSGGARGSRVIVTTRNQGVVSAIGGATCSAYPLKGLSDDECLSLLAQQALGTSNFDDYPELKDVAEKIAEKCKGLPLAAKTLGGMLRTNQNPGAWEDILKSKIWYLPDQENNQILPALKLSYHHLPSHLKRCFAYCSIFPKDYEFYVDELVLLWMGEGFLHQVNGQRQMEEIGKEFFRELSARSFFQQSDGTSSPRRSFFQQSDGTSSQFVMHDLVHDLARFVAGDTCFNLEDKLENNELHHTISKRARHSSLIRKRFEIARKFESFGKVKTNLRTLISLPTNIWSWFDRGYISQKVLHDLLTGMRCLRVLSFAGYHIAEVPDLIGKLKHLRYLNFSNCSIKRLPDSVGDLYNLQTLILRDCGQLIRLPKGIEKLINLRHLDIIGTSKLQEMSFQVGNLTNLQTLSRFIVSKSGGSGSGSGSGSGMGELKNLSNLQGVLSISKLHEMVKVEDASCANLKDKQKLEELVMEWHDEFWDSRNDADELRVLESLQPHENLKRLKVEFYGGSKFPSWIGKPCFSKMVRLTLQGCKNCRSLPSLGGLASLEALHIEGMGKVESIDDEFYGENMNPAFASLKELWFEDMPEWERWSHSNLMKNKNLRVFPKLEKLEIIKCPKLMEFDVSECPESVGGLAEGEAAAAAAAAASAGHEIAIELQSSVMMRLEKLRIKGCPKLESFSLPKTELGLPSMLRSLRVLDCKNLKGLPPLNDNSCAALESLEISCCPSLKRFPNGDQLPLPLPLPTTLKRLKIRDCENLESLPEGIMMQAQQQEEEEEEEAVLTTTGGIGWPKLESFLQSGWLPPMLRRLVLLWCRHLALKFLPPPPPPPPPLHSHNYNNNSNSECALESLEIDGCPSLLRFPNGMLPTTLKQLSINNCQNLESLPEGIMIPCNSTSNCSSLEYLSISGCRSLKSFPTGEFQLPSTLKRLEIERCPNLESMSENNIATTTATTALEYLRVWDYPNLRTLPECLHSLKELNIYDCEGLEYCFPARGGVLGFSNPIPNLTVLRISGCRNLKSLPYQLRNLISLQVLSIRHCPGVVSFPEGGFPFPRYLTSLQVESCQNLKPPLSEWGLQSLISLSELTIMNMFPDMVSFPDEEHCLLPSSLTSLEISGMASLTSLSLPILHSLTSLEVSEMKSLVSLPLQNLTSLRSLYISNCPKLCSLGLLPSTLERVEIHDCPIIKERCLKGKREYYPNIANIPGIWIDYELIQVQ